MFFPLASAFIVEKEEEAILFHRAAERSSENVADELIGKIRLAASGYSRLDEPVVRAGYGVAMVFVERTVKIVCAALGDQCHLGSGTVALVGIVVRGGHAEFLHGIEGGGED